MAIRIGLLRSSALQNDGLDVPIILQCRAPRETNPNGHWGSDRFLIKLLFWWWWWSLHGSLKVVETKQEAADRKKKEKDERAAQKADKLNALSPKEKARLKAKQLLKQASDARELAQQMLVLDADEKSQTQLRTFADNCDKNHANICALIDAGADTPEHYVTCEDSIAKGMVWFAKKGALCKGMVTAANRVAVASSS
jgi:hypothetical protein